MQKYLIEKTNKIKYETHQKIIIFLYKYIMIKFFVWLKIQGTCLNIKMSLYTIANINWSEIKINSTNSKTRQGGPFSLYIFNILCKSLARAIKLKERKVIQITKAEL